MDEVEVPEVPEGVLCAFEEAEEMARRTPQPEAVHVAVAPLRDVENLRLAWPGLLLRDTLDSLEAYEKAQLAEPFRQLADFRAHLVNPLPPPSADFMTALKALLAEPFEALAAGVQAQLVSPWRSLTDSHQAQSRAAIRSAWSILATQRQFASLDAASVASLLMTPTITVNAQVVTAEVSEDVAGQPDAQQDSKRSIDFGAAAIGLLWAWAAIMPVIAAHLSTADQGNIAMYIATISLALIITWRMNDNRKR